MKIIRIMWIGILIIIFLGACSAASPSQTGGVSPTDIPASQYPGPYIEATKDSAYPAPATPVPGASLPTSTSDPQMGNVQGVLLLNGQPVNNVFFYLAEIIKDKTGKDIVAGLDRVNSPNTHTNNDGSFAFINMKPGKYGLILDVATNQFLINYPDETKAIVITVEAGKTVDLGTLDYDSLPLP